MHGATGEPTGVDDEPAQVGARVRADWNRVLHVYSQCMDVVQDEQASYLPPVLAAFLAEVLARVSSNYYGTEDQYVLDALEIFGERDGTGSDQGQFRAKYLDERFLRFAPYAPNRPDGSRRRPTPFEAVVETARRLRDLNALEDTLRSGIGGAVLGGSASYGRFYNVVGANSGSSPSDLDLLLIVNDYADIAEICPRLGDLPGASAGHVARLSERASQFVDDEVFVEFSPVIFSGKTRLWDNNSDPILSGTGLQSAYDVSLHIASRATFDQIVLRAAPQVSLDQLPSSRLIYDFRETEPGRQDHQRSFSGKNLRLAIDTFRAGESFVRSTHAYHIDDHDRYYPGMLQNLLLPQFEVRWASTPVRRQIEAFRWKMVERLRYERQVRPHDFLRLSLSHTRSEVFAPHIVRSVDASTLIS